MSTRIYTVSDLITIQREYDDAWKAAKSEAELPEPPNFSGCEFDPCGLVGSLGEIESDLPWLNDFLASCANGKWHRFAVAEFELPIHVRRPATERFGRTLTFSHEGLGDINVDIIYRDSSIQFEFVGLL
jgi:hypothetical protein